MKAEIDKLDNNELVNVPTGLNDLKTKVDDLESASWKLFLKIFKKLSYTVEKEVVKRETFWIRKLWSWEQNSC